MMSIVVRPLQSGIPGIAAPFPSGKDGWKLFVVAVRAKRSLLRVPRKSQGRLNRSIFGIVIK